MDNFKGRAAFVTGGASGIGLGIARQLLAEGCSVAIADLQPDHLNEAKEQLSAYASSSIFLIVDVTDRAAMAEAANELERTFGRVDILVNNAGVGVQGPFKLVSYADWDFGLGVNLGGAVNGIQTFVPRIRAGGRGGHVINTSSLGGLVAGTSAGAIYATSKAAIVALTESIRDSLAEDGIGTSVLCPGPIKSRIHEMNDQRPAKFAANQALTDAAKSVDRPRTSDLWMGPNEVGRMVVDGIRSNSLYIITHGDFRPMVEARHAAILDAMPTKVNPDLSVSLMPRAKE